MTKKIKCISLYPSEREKYPDWYSKTELKKMKLMPKKNVKAVALVIRKSYGDYYLYDINKTTEYRLTKKQKAELNKRAKIRRQEKLEQERIQREKETCKVCNNQITYKEQMYKSRFAEYPLPYICKTCYKKIYEAHRQDWINKLMSKNILVIDVETTGLDPCYDEILQISIIDKNGEILLNEYCKPEKITDWSEAASINNIYPEDVEKCKPFSYYKNKIFKLINNADVVVGYNIEFDLSMIGYDIYNDDIIEIADVMYMFAKVYGDWSNYYKSYKYKSLKVCADYYNYEFNPHDSLEDVKATLYCYPRVAYDLSFNVYNYIGAGMK